MDEYRIDKAYEKIYEYCKADNCYYFLCTFAQIDVTRRNRKKTIIKKIETWKDNSLYR